ncbi:D-alanyl-D-alanine carboxypeptidase family protein [Candidatus Parcubacteria bacterium]|nr:D-alanyl-D-alanine carboxypeptidase family protein [Candidatus Parcubacteria bacterium]
MKNFLPAAIGIVALSILAFFAFAHIRALEAGRTAALSELTAAEEDKYALIKSLRGTNETLRSFQGEISGLSSTLGVLQKLSQTDPELLKKYSKVYFLNENYVPVHLAEVEPQFVSKGATNFQILAQVWPHLQALLIAAHDDGTSILVASGYRSFTTQLSLKSAYKVTYGSGANAFSADQGYSEHQLGTAVDFTDTKLGANFDAFAKEAAYTWLANHAHLYGFVLSYPEGNAYYKFEPWHWRYVGVALATKLHDEGKRFYDLDQREIDKYLVNLFE